MPLRPLDSQKTDLLKRRTGSTNKAGDIPQTLMAQTINPDETGRSRAETPPRREPASHGSGCTNLGKRSLLSRPDDSLIALSAPLEYCFKRVNLLSNFANLAANG